MLLMDHPRGAITAIDACPSCFRQNATVRFGHGLWAALQPKRGGSRVEFVCRGDPFDPVEYLALRNTVDKFAAR
jgi:hypothetical protein